MSSAWPRRPVPRLIAIADRAAWPDQEAWLAHVEALAAAVPTELGALMLRHPWDGARPSALLEAVGRCGAARERRLAVIVNGLESEAARLRLDWLYFRESAIPERPLEATRALGWSLGAAIHDLDGLERAVAADLDYVVFAPVFAPSSKPGVGRGLPALAEIAKASPIPMLALGGLTPERVVPCLEAGAHGVAVLGHLHHDAARRLGELEHCLRRPPRASLATEIV